MNESDVCEIKISAPTHPLPYVWPVRSDERCNQAIIYSGQPLGLSIKRKACWGRKKLRNLCKLLKNVLSANNNYVFHCRLHRWDSGTILACRDLYQGYRLIRFHDHFTQNGRYCHSRAMRSL